MGQSGKMKQLVVISGKGGTGKTTVSAALAALGPERKVLADCDVDASNLPLALQAAPRSEEPFWAGKIAEIDRDLCTGCCFCLEKCRFEAIVPDNGRCRVNPLACEGCSVCALVCPENAIRMNEVECGILYESQSSYGTTIHASLHPGRENSGKLVTAVRDKALEASGREGAGVILIDGSPGIGCPVIASLSGVDLALVVTEPTPAGLQGMDRVMQVARHFGIPSIACINKVDLSEARVRDIEARCKDFKVDIVGRIPFDRAVAEANSKLIPLPQAGPSMAGQAMEELAKEVFRRLDAI